MTKVVLTWQALPQYQSQKVDSMSDSFSGTRSGSFTGTRPLHQQTVSAWISSIGQDRGLPLNLGEDGHCSLQCGDELQCIIEVPADDETQAVFLYIPLLSLPENDAAQLALTKAALELNMFGLETGGSQISLDNRTQHLVLSFAAQVEMLDEELFRQSLGDFLDMGVSLHAKFLELSEQSLPSQHIKPATNSIIV